MNVIQQVTNKGPAGKSGQLGRHAGDAQSESKINEVPIPVSGYLIFLSLAVFDQKDGSTVLETPIVLCNS
jgi:hypothetical protein